jgi:flagellar basal body-associated protein FliL
VCWIGVIALLHSKGDCTVEHAGDAMDADGCSSPVLIIVIIVVAILAFAAAAIGFVMWKKKASKTNVAGP